MKLVAEYRRRVLAVKTLVHSALTAEEASELRRIALSWERAARLREEYLKANPPSQQQRPQRPRN